MDEAGIREGFAVWATVDANNRYWVEALEGVAGVAIGINGRQATLTPDQARRLASRLYRLARRVENRTVPSNA